MQLSHTWWGWAPAAACLPACLPALGPSFRHVGSGGGVRPGAAAPQPEPKWPPVSSSQFVPSPGVDALSSLASSFSFLLSFCSSRPPPPFPPASSEPRSAVAIYRRAPAGQHDSRVAGPRNAVPARTTPPRLCRREHAHQGRRQAARSGGARGRPGVEGRHGPAVQGEEGGPVRSARGFHPRLLQDSPARLHTAGGPAARAGHPGGGVCVRERRLRDGGLGPGAQRPGQGADAG